MAPDEVAGEIDAERLAQWRRLQMALGRLLDGVAGLNFKAEIVPELVENITALTERLGAPESDPDLLLQSLHQLPSRGRFSIPPFSVDRLTVTEAEGTVMFGRRHGGRNRAAHGGAIAMLFDEALGGLVNRPGQPRARTARLVTHFRSVAPVDKSLTVRASITAREGRKIHARGELSDAGVLCAEAEGLFVVLRPGQP